jgi:hypothetical protein
MKSKEAINVPATIGILREKYRPISGQVIQASALLIM